MSEIDSTTARQLMGLQMDQIQATAGLTERIAKLEVEVHNLRAGQTRLMMFAGIVGSVVGFAVGHVSDILAYLGLS